jgi:predicted nucleotidyltransferase
VLKSVFTWPHLYVSQTESAHRTQLIFEDSHSTTAKLSVMSRSDQLLAAVTQAKFAHLDGLIHLFVGGSELHGAKVKDADDLDIYGVYLEPPELVVGLDQQDFCVWSTAGDERRNGPDDVDVCLYSLRKWAGLAAKGNATALHFLFAPNFAPNPEPWAHVLAERELFLSRKAAEQFRGFAEAQIRRVQGIGTGKKGQREEFISVHGYDVKAAMHTIRLLHEGIELMRAGTITLPRPEKELLISIRTGQYGSLERVLRLAETLFKDLDRAESESRLPESVDRKKISKLVSDVYLRYWSQGNGSS